MATLQVFRRRRKAIIIVTSIVLVLVAAFVTLLALRWPFTESRVLASIREAWPGTVLLGRFHSNIFPHPGCTIENLVLELPSERSKEPVRATFGKIQIRALYLDLLLRPGRLSSLVTEGLRVEIPVYSPEPSAAESGTNEESQNGSNKERNKGKSSTTFGEVETHDAVLVVNRSGDRGPLTFAIHRLLMWPVRPDAPMSFEAALTNAEPPGEIQVKGKLGPVRSREPGDLLISGSYAFERADLGVFRGICGILSSAGTFDGPLAHLKVQGSIDIPEFQVTRSHHEVDLRATFNAVEDALHGNTTLENVDASFLRTKVHAEGKIAPVAGKSGKTTDLNLRVRNGRIQDVLDLFVTDKMPPMEGATSLETHIIIPPGETPFLKKLAMDGKFSIANAVLTNQSRQQQIDELSKRARGKEKERETEKVTSHSEGNVRLQGGVAQFKPLMFEIPGASVAMSGRFNLLNEQIEFYGDARTAAVLSKQTSGIKSALLKPLDWIFKKKNAGAEIPVKMTGTYNDPHFGLDLADKK